MGSTDWISKRPAETRMMLDELVRRLAAEERAQSGVVPELGPFITLSRQAGVAGKEIAHTVAGELGWKVLDREMVEALADELELDPHRLELMDERGSNWFRDTLLNLLDSRLVLQHDYVARLGRVMALAAHSGQVIIVGRAGHLILPRSQGLRIRVVGDRSWRVNRVSAEKDLTVAAAGELVDAVDAERSGFLQHNFKRHPDDPGSHDVVIDVSTLGSRATVSLICTAARLRGLV